MSIRHAILGLLSETPMHGYRLKEIFAKRVSPLWGLTTGQIYQSLATLERGGLLESRGERAGRRPTRRIYSVTERGRTEMAAWLAAAPSAWTRPFREDLLIRLMFLRKADVGALCQSLARQEHEATLLLARVTHLRSGAAHEATAIDVRGTFLDGMTHHLEADIRLLQRCREEVDRWAKTDEARAPSTRRAISSDNEGARAPTATLKARTPRSPARPRPNKGAHMVASSAPDPKFWQQLGGEAATRRSLAKRMAFQ
jgi:DNA-binding PadR family transcriptional regulator